MHLVVEQTLLASAGTMRANRDFVTGDDMFIAIDADNLTDFDLRVLIDAHRAAGTVATLALFRASDPTQVGVVEVNDGLVVGFEEKPAHPRRRAVPTRYRLPSTASTGRPCSGSRAKWQLFQRHRNARGATPGPRYWEAGTDCDRFKHRAGSGWLVGVLICPVITASTADEC